MKTNRNNSQQQVDAVAIGTAIAAAQAQDSRAIIYRSAYRSIAGSVTGAILFQQIVYRFIKSGAQEFYKFRRPCAHPKYRAGDSWCEELGFSPAEFDNAIGKIGTKITRGVSKDAARLGQVHPDFRQHLVLYYTDANRVTWWSVNTLFAGIAIYLAYNQSDILLQERIGVELPQKKLGFYTYLQDDVTVDISIIERDSGYALQITCDYEEEDVTFESLQSANPDRQKPRSPAVKLPLPRDYLAMAAVTGIAPSVAAPNERGAAELFLQVFEDLSGQGQIESPRREQWLTRLTGEVDGIDLNDAALREALGVVFSEERYNYLTAVTPFNKLFNDAWRAEYRRVVNQQKNVNNRYGV